MSKINPAPKVCPSCRALTPVHQMTKVVSRCSGRTSYSSRCLACMKKKAIAIKAVKEGAK